VSPSVTRPTLPARVTIREVGPRDGLQAEPPMPVAARADLITQLSQTGLPKIEAVSFVSPTAVPAMADAAAVWSQVKRAEAVHYSALVPNRKGAEAALAAGGFGSLQVFLAASEGYNRKNVGKSVDESIVDVAEVVAVAGSAGIPVDCSISAAFGDPYEGDVAPERLSQVAERVREAGVGGISLGDTTGMATPTRVWDVVALLRERMPDLHLNLHFHDTRGAGLANVLAAMESGCNEFDSSVGGLGGSPFAPSGANGNVSTEDLVHMLADMGIETGVRLEALLEVTELVRELVGHELRSQVARAGPRWWVTSRREGGE
jgi:hydroxymethylglutaryl-CoA lyase